MTIMARGGHCRAIVTATDDGIVVRHEVATTRGGATSWRFDRECRPQMPFHAVLDQVHRAIGGE